MLNVCEACTKKEFSLPHIDPNNNSKVCTKCHLFLTSLSGPELQKIYAHLGNQTLAAANRVPSNNNVSADTNIAQNRSFSTSQVDDRSVTPTRKKMFNLFGNADSGSGKLSAKPTDTSRSLSPLRMLATPSGRSYSVNTVSPSNTISRANFGANLPPRDGRSISTNNTSANGSSTPPSFGLSSSDPSRSTLLSKSPK